MENLYGVHVDEMFLVVKAKDQENALDVLAEYLTDHDEMVNEEIDSFSLNMSFFEKFYCDDKGHLFDYDEMKEPAHLEAMSDEERDFYIETWIEKNVREYFKNVPDYGEMYLQERKKYIEYVENLDDDEVIRYQPDFSRDFYINTIKLMLLKGDFYGEMTMKQIDLEKNLQIIVDQSI